MEFVNLCSCGCGGNASIGKKFISGHNGRGERKPRITRLCLHCSKEFSGTEAAIEKRIYCCAACRNAHRKTLTGEANPLFLRVDATCPTCGKKIKIKQWEKSNRTKYCSKECGAIGRSKKLRDKEWTVTHWRSVALRAYGRSCAICQFQHAIDVHHIKLKSQGGSNEIENLIPLCPNHHHMAHLNLISVEDLKRLQEEALQRMRK